VISIKKLLKGISPRPTVIVHDGHVITLDWGLYRSRFLLDDGYFYYMGTVSPGGSESYYEAKTLNANGETVTYMLFIQHKVFSKRVIIKVYRQGTYWLDAPGELVYCQ
jgi:hypothetical protein